MVAHAYNPSYSGGKVGGLWSEDEPGKHVRLSLKRKTKS
jgi:hypothetical protein